MASGRFVRSALFAMMARCPITDEARAGWVLLFYAGHESPRARLFRATAGKHGCPGSKFPRCLLKWRFTIAGRRGRFRAALRPHPLQPGEARAYELPARLALVEFPPPSRRGTIEVRARLFNRALTAEYVFCRRGSAMRVSDVRNLVDFNTRMGMFICPTDRVTWWRSLRATSSAPGTNVDSPNC